MKFKAAVVSLLAAMLAVITVGMSIMVMEAKKQTEAAEEATYLAALQFDYSIFDSYPASEYTANQMNAIMGIEEKYNYKYKIYEPRKAIFEDILD